jgi:hypothetical protein
MPWYQKPILQDAIVLDIQRGALVTGVYSLVSWYSEVVYEMELEICLLAIMCLDLLTSLGILLLG